MHPPLIFSATLFTFFCHGCIKENYCCLPKTTFSVGCLSLPDQKPHENKPVSYAKFHPAGLFFTNWGQGHKQSVQAKKEVGAPCCFPLSTDHIFWDGFSSRDELWRWKGFIHPLKQLQSNLWSFALILMVAVVMKACISCSQKIRKL